MKVTLFWNFDWIGDRKKDRGFCDLDRWILRSRSSCVFFDQIAIADRDLYREKKIAITIDDQKIADHLCLELMV